MSCNFEMQLLVLEQKFLKQCQPTLLMNQSECYKPLHFQRQNLIFGSEIRVQYKERMPTNKSEHVRSQLPPFNSELIRLVQK